MTTWKHYLDYDLRDGTLSFESQPDFDNGTPFVVYHGLVLRFKLPAHRSYVQEEILDWAQEQFGEQFATLREGWREDYNGHDWVGMYDTPEREEQAVLQAQAFQDQIDDLGLTDSIPGKEIWDAADYWLNGLTWEQTAAEMGIVSGTSDTELEEIAHRVRMQESHVTLRNLYEFLLRVRDECESDEEDDEDE